LFIQSAQERTAFLEAREALLWLNAKEPSCELAVN
jgi:hypothetical protein